MPRWVISVHPYVNPLMWTESLWLDWGHRVGDGAAIGPGYLMVELMLQPTLCTGLPGHLLPH